MNRYMRLGRMPVGMKGRLREGENVWHTVSCGMWVTLVAKGCYSRMITD